eukprot:2142433-Pyramimonas_sp.AAC.1
MGSEFENMSARVFALETRTTEIEDIEIRMTNLENMFNDKTKHPNLFEPWKYNEHRAQRGQLPELPTIPPMSSTTTEKGGHSRYWQFGRF